MITPSMVPPYISKGTFKISSEVKPFSVVQMNISLDTRVLEKNAHAVCNHDGLEIEDSVNIGPGACTDYKKIPNQCGLEFCHEHLLDIVV